MQEAVVTLYSVIEDARIVVDAFIKRFEDALKSVEESEDAITLILQDDSTVILHPQSEPAFIQQQVAGMRNYFATIPAKNTDVLKSVLNQIELFTCITGVSFSLNEDENRTSYIMGSIFEVAQDSASIVLYPTMSLFTPQGDLLLSKEGESDVAVWHPIAHQGILRQERTYTEADQQRYQEVTQELKKAGYPSVSYLLSTQLTLDSIDVPSIEEIARRCVCLFACAVCAEGTLMEDGSREIGLSEYEWMNQRFGCDPYLSDEERDFIHGEEPEQMVSIRYSWRYESCAVLLWALGLYEINASFQSLCDVAGIAQTLRSFDNMDALCKAAKRRSEVDLLRLHTRVLYFDWSCVEARIHNQEVAGIEPGIVQEYHYALNWLCNANETRDWDAIQCNT